MKYIALSLLLAFWSFGASLASEFPGTPEEVAKKIQETYSKHCCFRALFDQLTVNVAMDITDKFQGIMYVKKPGKIMLDVQFPEKQHVLVEGRNYVVSFPDEGNAARGEIPPELNLEHFFGFFANIVNLDQNFSVTFPAKTVDVHERLIFLQLTDKKNPGGNYNIMIGIDADGYFIRRAIIYDALGNYNRFDLSGLKFLDNIPESQFKITHDIPESKTGGSGGK